MCIQNICEARQQWGTARLLPEKVVDELDAVCAGTQGEFGSVHAARAKSSEAGQEPGPVPGGGQRLTGTRRHLDNVAASQLDLGDLMRRHALQAREFEQRRGSKRSAVALSSLSSVR